MHIRCENCSVEHDLDPPAWVVSTGRPFRFRCSACGFSQMVQPPAPVTAQTVVAPPSTAQPLGANAELPTEDLPKPPGESASPPVYLKQEGKVYLVRDWATVQRWIMERRVEREDLVSEGGVRWEPIGTRPELGSFFAAVEQIEASEVAATRDVTIAPAATPAPVPPPPAFTNAPSNPFAGPSSFPFGSSDDDDDPVTSSRFGRLDDDTEGVPMGLPHLPTEEVPVGDATLNTETDDDYPELPPSRRGFDSMPTLIRDVNPAPFDEPAPPALVQDENPTERFRGDSADDFAMGEVFPPALPTEDPAPPRIEAPKSEPKFDMPPLRGPALDTQTDHDTQVSIPPPSDTQIDDDPFGDFHRPDPHTSDDWGTPIVKAKTGVPIWIWGVGAAITVLVVVAVIALAMAMNQAPVKPVVVEEPATLEKVLPVEIPVETIEVPTEIPPVPAPGLAVPPVVTPTPGEAKAPPLQATDPEKEAAKEAARAALPKDPAVPKAVNVKAAVDAGWKAVDKGKLSEAAAQFKKGLDSSPDDAAANQGYGYVLLQQGQTAQATGYLCRALAKAGPSSDVGREASGMIARNDLTCP